MTTSPPPVDQTIPTVQPHGRHVEAHVLDEVGFRPERQPTHRRVQPVGAEHQVEPARLGAVEGDAHPVLVLIQGDDGVVEQELGVVPTRLVQDRGEVAARQLHLAAAGRLLQGPQVDPSDAPARGVDEAHAGHVRAGLADAWHDPHPLGHVHGRPSDVHRTAAGPQRPRAFDDGGMESVPRQPVGQGRPGDAGSGDQHGLVAHDMLLSLPPLHLALYD
jgi:hypothetical protein